MTAAPFLQVRTWRNFSDGKSGTSIPSVELANKMPFLEYASNFLHAFCFSSSFGSSGDEAKRTEEVGERESLSASWFNIVDDVDERVLLLASLEMFGGVKFCLWSDLDHSSASVEQAATEGVWRFGMVVWLWKAQRVRRTG